MTSISPPDQHLAEASDVALVFQVARYDQAALAELYRRHGGAVAALTRRLLDGDGRADEVVQEVFLTLWHQPERFDPERGQLRSFLLTIAHRRAIDVLRSDRARRAREDSTATTQASATYDLDREVWDLALAEHVRDALASIDARERHAIELAYFGGMTYVEVAATLGEPEGTTKSRIRSGLRRLRAELSARGITVGEALS